MFLYIKKSERIEAFSIRKETSGFIHEECFDTHIGNSVLRLRSSVRQNVGLQNQMSEVQILSGSPCIWAVGIVGNTVALQASVPGSNPGRSTKLESEKHWRLQETVNLPPYGIRGSNP